MDRASEARRTGVRTPVFRRLMASYGVSLFGDGIRMIALLLVAFLVTGSPLAVGAVAAAELIPWLLFSVPMGALVDRWNPRTALLRAHLGRATLSALLVWAIIADRASVLVLCVLAFVLTVVETIADAASQVLMVTVAGSADLLPANTRMRTIETLLVNLVGPLAGGALVRIEPALAFAVDGATFVLAAALVVSLPGWTGRVEQEAPGLPPAALSPTGHPAAETSPPPRLSLRASVVEGLTTLRSVPGLWLLVSVTAWTSMATGAVNAMMAPFALQVLGLSPAMVPVIIAAQAVGILLGAQLAGRFSSWRTDGVAMATGVFLVGGPVLLVGLVPVTGVVFGAYVVSGTGFGLWNVLASIRRQRLTPPRLLGRVSNASRAINWGSMPVGAVLGGVAAAALNLQSVWIISGSVIVVVGLLSRRALVRSVVPVAAAAARQGAV